ncbi:hypothetical protein NKG05_17775 [Oerskovia sp. M15]
MWLPASLAHRLSASPRAAEDLARLRATLAEHGLQVHTLNAFPYGGFHDDVVKLAVYSPTWADAERLAYTLECAEVLAALLPDGVDGSISTLPLAWREPGGCRGQRPRTPPRPGRSRTCPPGCATSPSGRARSCASRSSPSPAACSTRSRTW